MIRSYFINYILYIQTFHSFPSFITMWLFLLTMPYFLTIFSFFLIYSFYIYVYNLFKLPCPCLNVYIQKYLIWSLTAWNCLYIQGHEKWMKSPRMILNLLPNWIQRVWGWTLFKIMWLFHKFSSNKSLWAFIKDTVQFKAVRLLIFCRCATIVILLNYFVANVSKFWVGHLDKSLQCGKVCTVRHMYHILAILFFMLSK